MVQLRLCLALLFVLEETLVLAEENTTAANVITTASQHNALQVPARKQMVNDIEVVVDTRRKAEKSKEKKKQSGRSTSSSSGSREKKGSDESSSASSAEESLGLSDEMSSSSDSRIKKAKKYERKSSAERKGWRKWHRKCVPCPEEMALKWKDPSIKWICGAYQRAQRSFKSLCMMHYRNCQDGTMFTKIHDHRCKDDSERVGRPHGDHFFYTYHVVLSAYSSKSVSSSKKSSADASDSGIYREDIDF